MIMSVRHLCTRPSRGLIALTRSGQRQVHLTALVLWICLGCTLFGCHGDRRESFYPSLVDAKKDGAIDRGWIPDFLPESSRNIHELHEISSPTTWCAFEFVLTDPATLRKSLKADAGSLSLVGHVPSPRKSWWPAVLVGNLDTAKIHEAGFEL